MEFNNIIEAKRKGKQEKPDKDVKDGSTADFKSYQDAKVLPRLVSKYKNTIKIKFLPPNQVENWLEENGDKKLGISAGYNDRGLMVILYYNTGTDFTTWATEDKQDLIDYIYSKAEKLAQERKLTEQPNEKVFKPKSTPEKDVEDKPINKNNEEVISNIQKVMAQLSSNSLADLYDLANSLYKRDRRNK